MVPETPGVGLAAVGRTGGGTRNQRLSDSPTKAPDQAVHKPTDGSHALRSRKWKRGGALLLDSKRRDSVQDVLPQGQLHQSDGTLSAAHGVSSSCSEETSSTCKPTTDSVTSGVQGHVGTGMAVCAATEDCDATMLDEEAVIDLTVDTSLNGSGLSQEQLRSDGQVGSEHLRATAPTSLVATATTAPGTEVVRAGSGRGSSSGQVRENSQKVGIDG